MYVKQRNDETYDVKFSLRRGGQRIEFTHSLTPIPLDKRSVKQIAKDFESKVGRRLELIKNGDLQIPADALATRKALKAFIMDVPNDLPAKSTDSTIQKLVKDYLASRKLEVETSDEDKKLSIDSYESDERRLSQFLTYCKGKGKSSLSAVVNAEFLEEYRNTQLELVALRKRKGKPHGTGQRNAKHRLRTVKALLIWADKKERIDRIPKNVKDGEFANVPLPKPQPKFYTPEQIAKLYTAANEQQRLWILLGLNCGYLQNDLATLTHDMVDWKQGVIKRPRQKTGVPSEHKLWPLTLKKLCEQATDVSEQSLVLLNSKGNPLMQKTIADDGKVTISDTIVQAFAKLKKAAKVTGQVTFKNLRKSGANAIEGQFQDKPWLPTLYLAQELAGKVRTFYTQQSYDELHTATDWLAEYFGFNEGGTLSKLGVNNSK